MTGKSYKKPKFALASILTATICWGCMFHPQQCYAVTTSAEDDELSYYYSEDYYVYGYNYSDYKPEQLVDKLHVLEGYIYSNSDISDEDKRRINHLLQETIEYIRQPELIDHQKQQDFKNAVFLLPLILVLMVGFFAGYFVRGKADEEKHREEQEKLLNSNKKNSAPKTDKPVNQKVAVAETRIQTIEEPARDEIAQGETVQEDSQETQTPIINDPKEVPQYKAEHEATILFAGIPHEGIFSDAVTKNAGKAFYFIEAIGTTGEFSFISNETTLRYAKSSTTEFIECACNIVDNAGGFSNVITTRKGKVEKSGNDWKIIQKAEVRLG